MSSLENIVDTSTLAGIQRETLITKDFSVNDELRHLEKLQTRNILLEPIRRLEFDVLLSLVTKLAYKPYQSSKVKDNQLKISIEDLNVPSPDKQDFLTLSCSQNKSSYWFDLKPAYKAFSDVEKLKTDKLYKKLWDLCICKDLKTLYYFLYKYKYDFLATIRYKYSVLYDNLKVIDDYLDSLGYHKKLIKDEEL